MINRDNSLTSRVDISCKREGAKTLLVNSYFDIPYKVVHYGSKRLQDHLEVMMMCYSPGVMDGDALQVSVHCPEHVEMKLFTQSFNKVHPMKKGASQAMHVKVDEHAILQYLPQPTIPFKNAIFDMDNLIEVAANGHLIWGDIISGGRIHSGERFEFSKLHSRTKVYSGGKLVFFDNQLMAPRKQPLERMLFFEGHTHQGTLLIVSEYAKAFKEELDEVLTEQFVDMRYGFTMSGPNTLLIRALGESGDAMHEWLSNIGDMCWSFIRHHTADMEPVKTPAKVTASKQTLKKKATPATKRQPAKKVAAKKAVAKL
ncbi:urease accessory protein UreD [Chitinophaga nivalis]|uniref:Urease accessory protein UreD n=1 Tax=Chitinophaga nivalis TaxID=2991709 RepID=A0ABT3IN43_9BACT|nr:urease accessory protein UreD [Chitinophaga nivalis]MCW3464927.1 urease accessory protein UreD [Chitinophaga nivalis]MCW3485381.1 urease accessory protein UreD [Chitinophaga nivalis]